MIIESGTDVVQVLCGSVSTSDPRGLWIVAMDDCLRLLFVEPLAVDIADGVESHLDDIESYIEDSREIAYFVLAWATEVPIERDDTWLLDLEARLKTGLELQASRLLGVVVFDGSAVYASVSRCNFSLEPEFQDLPRALPLLGPHGFDCACPLCVSDRRSYDDYRDDYDPGDEYGDGYGEGYGEQYRERLRSRYGDAYVDSPLDEFEGIDDPRWDPIWKRWYPDPERAYKRWTRDEETRVVQCHFDGLTCFDISVLMHRQPTAIAARLRKLGLSSKTVVPEVVTVPPPLLPPPVQ